MATVNKIEELNSFVKKFSALWAAGSDASLSLESNGGQVFVTLRLGLGEHPSKMYDTNIGNTTKLKLLDSLLQEDPDQLRLVWVLCVSDSYKQQVAHY